MRGGGVIRNESIYHTVRSYFALGRRRRTEGGKGRDTRKGGREGKGMGRR